MWHLKDDSIWFIAVKISTKGNEQFHNAINNISGIWNDIQYGIENA